MYSLGLLMVVNFKNDGIKFHKTGNKDYTKIVYCAVDCDNYITIKPGNARFQLFTS